jgi:hypothetical protein
LRLRVDEERSMPDLAYLKDVLDLLYELGVLKRMKFRLGGELVFSYNSEGGLQDVLEAFEKFHYEYNTGRRCNVVRRELGSGGAALLLAATSRYWRVPSGSAWFPNPSAGRKVWFRNMWMLLGFSECSERKCMVDFLALAKSRKLAEEGYAQVREFFTEAARSLLGLERWDRLEEEGGGVVTLRTPRKRVSEGAAPGTLTEASPPALRICMVCGLGFHQGDLLAWCPFCGAAAHRLHLLEFLHVKENCPVCGHHLVESDLGDQLGRANLHLPTKRAK